MDKVIEKFKALRLKNCAQNLADILDQAARENLSALQTIDRLLEIEKNRPHLAEKAAILPITGYFSL